MTATKPQKKKICKTVRFEGTPILQKFCNAQSNFNASMRYIILDYIRRNRGQVFDVAQHVQTACDNVLAGLASPEDLETAKVFLPSAPEEEEPAPRKEEPSFPKNAASQKKTPPVTEEADDDEIPACYR